MINAQEQSIMHAEHPSQLESLAEECLDLADTPAGCQTDFQLEPAATNPTSWTSCKPLEINCEHGRTENYI